MVQIEGKYAHGGSEGLEEFLTKVGGAKFAEDAKAFVESKPAFDFFEKDGEWVIVMTKEGKTSTSSFKLGVPYDDTIAHGADYTFLPTKQCPTSVTTRDGHKFKTVTEFPDGNKTIREYEFTDAGMKAHLSDQKFGVKAYRFYKRI